MGYGYQNIAIMKLKVTLRNILGVCDVMVVYNLTEYELKAKMAVVKFVMICNTNEGK